MKVGEEKDVRYGIRVGGNVRKERETHVFRERGEGLWGGERLSLRWSCSRLRPLVLLIGAAGW